MAFRQPTFSIAAAAGGNKHLDGALRSHEQRLSSLEEKVGGQAVDFNQHAPIAPKPPRARLSVNARPTTGRFVVTVTNPQFVSPAAQGNLSRVPIYHRLTYSTVSDFSSNVTALEPSHQTYFPVIDDPGVTLHFKLDSSFDGVTWNQPVLSGPVTA